MTYNDMLNAGIEMQGDVIITQYDSNAEDFRVRKPFSEICKSRKLRKLLDKEILYMYPNTEYLDGRNEVAVIVIEVAEEEE